MIYLDYAATSWPKPPGMLKAMTDFMESSGANPGRSGHHMSIASARVVYQCRESIAAFFNSADPMRVIFTPNATLAINLVLKGLLKPGDNVVTTSIEHNAVMRPLHFLEKKGLQIKVAQCSLDGTLDPQKIEELIDPRTRLVVMVHASNVSGTILPVAEVARIAHAKGTLLLVDVAQSAGILPIDIQKSGIDFLAFTGHKELLGPPGTGGLVIHPAIDPGILESFVQGGTGSRSSSEEQPEDLPDKYEAGTSNFIGIAGLRSSLDWLEQTTPAAISEHVQTLQRSLMTGLADIKKVSVYGSGAVGSSVGIVSFTIDDRPVSQIGLRLDEEYGILTRVGLHCSPAAHRTLGTLPGGTVRLSPGIFTTQKEIDLTLKAIQEIARS
jgi:cysteine desulfurase / selenocysteine lyase